MGFFRAAFACAFFGASSTLAAVTQTPIAPNGFVASGNYYIPQGTVLQSPEDFRDYLQTRVQIESDAYTSSHGLPRRTVIENLLSSAADRYPWGSSYEVLEYVDGSYDGSLWYVYANCPTGYTRVPDKVQCAPNGLRINFKNIGGPTSTTNNNICNGTNPIHAAIGNKYQVEADYIGEGLFLPTFKRYYNSSSATSLFDSYIGPTYPNNPVIGVRWRHTYTRSIALWTSISTSTAGIFHLDGKIAYFTLNATTGQWLPDSDISDRLQQTATGWTYTTSDDEVETYDTSGKLFTITNRAGLTQTLNYSDGTTGQNGGYVLDASGNPTSTMLPAGLLIRVTDSTGRTLAFGYDASSRIIKMTDPAGGIYRYAYDTNNNLTSVAYPDNSMRVYSYNEQDKTSNTNLPHALTGITEKKDSNDLDTRYASWYYDTQGRAISSEHGSNMVGGAVDKHSLAYNANGTTTITDPLNTARTYNFQTILGVVKSTGTDQPGGSGCGAASSAITYDTNGNVASRADFNQHKTCYAYDLTRNLETARVEGLASTADCVTALAAATLSGDARKITTVWDATYRLPHIITEAVGKPEERVTTLDYDATSGNLLSKEIKDTASSKTRTWTYTYTTAADNTLVNLLKTVDGPRTDVADITTYTYYSTDDTTLPIPQYRRGDLWKITNALNQTTTITAYDGNGRPLTLIDANTNPGTVTTTLTYWPRGWLKSKTVGSKTTSYDYDNVGQLTKVTLADGSFIQYTHDAAHRLTGITDNLLNRVHYTLDAIGNRVKEETFDSNNTLSAMKARDFDGLNRLWHDIAYFNDPNTPVATQYTYDANGNLTTVTAPANSGTDTTYRTTTFSYDALNRLTYAFDPVNTMVHPTQYSFDGLDQVKTITDPRSLITGYTVNALGDTTQQVSTDPGTTNRTFDEGGNVKTETNAKGIQTNFTYDALNRLTLVSVPATGASITYTWDTGTGCTYGIGRLCQMTARNGATTSFAYDDQGNRVKKTRTKSGVSTTTQYAYDGANRRSTVMASTSETLVSGRNTAGQINSLTTTNGTTTTLENQITYDGTGQVTSQTLGNGVILKASYDLSGQPISERANKHDGDINQDGVVNIVDVLFAAQIAEGLMTPTPDQIDHGDVAPAGNPDGKINVIDVLRIMRKYQGKENF